MPLYGVQSTGQAFLGNTAHVCALYKNEMFCSLIQKAIKCAQDIPDCYHKIGNLIGYPGLLLWRGFGDKQRMWFVGMVSVGMWEECTHDQ